MYSTIVSHIRSTTSLKKLYKQTYKLRHLDIKINFRSNLFESIPLMISTSINVYDGRGVDVEIILGSKKIISIWKLPSVTLLRHATKPSLKLPHQKFWAKRRNKSSS